MPPELRYGGLGHLEGEKGAIVQGEQALCKGTVGMGPRGMDGEGPKKASDGEHRAWDARDQQDEAGGGNGHQRAGIRRMAPSSVFTSWVTSSH